MKTEERRARWRRNANRWIKNHPGYSTKYARAWRERNREKNRLYFRNYMRKRRKLLPEYAIWTAIKQRCGNPENTAWRWYGGRGISVCERWRRSFKIFLRDVGSKPSPKHSLDRFPNPNGNYEPGNVRWATYKQQLETRRPRGPNYHGPTPVLSGRENCGIPKPLKPC